MTQETEGVILREITCIFIKEISVIDPDTGNDIEVEIWKDPESGGIFGIDSSFLELVNEEIPSPFNFGTSILKCAEELLKE